MPNGKNLSIEDATLIIAKFVQQETGRGTPIDQLAVGQKLDLQVLRDFIDAIDNHQQAANIDAVRIYFGRSTRPGTGSENYDIVLVPVLKINADGKDLDLHKVFDREAMRAELPTLVGNTLPCPNVCPTRGFFC